MSGINAVPRTTETALSADERKAPARDEHDEPRPRRPRVPDRPVAPAADDATHKLNVSV